MSSLNQVPLERYLWLEESLRIFRSNLHPKGADALLASLAQSHRLGRWVPNDTLTAETGQRVLHSRASELYKRQPFRIGGLDYWLESNRRGGAEAAYRLTADRPMRIPITKE